MGSPSDSFPRRFARTRRFTLGEPRSFRVAADGSAVAFLRSGAGDDPVHSLWLLDLDDGGEREVCNPRSLGAGDADLPPEERARRERTRESGEGIVAFSADRLLRRAVFALGGRLFEAQLRTGEVRELPAAGPVVDPRLDPTGRRVGYVSGGALRVLDLDRSDRLLAGEDDLEVTWGLAEFVASEEMGRTEGHWWSPDGEALLAARVDTSPVRSWHIANPADPAAEPAVVRYPAAGTPNAAVELAIVGLDGNRTGVRWDRDAFPYVVRVRWPRGRSPTVLVQSRDQRSSQVLVVDERTGQTEVVHEDRDEAWLDVMDGVPSWLEDGRLVMTVLRDDTRRLAFAGELVTPPGLEVRRVVDVGDGVVFSGSEEPTEVHLWRAEASGELRRLTQEPGVHDGVAAWPVVVVVGAAMGHDGMRATVTRGGSAVTTVRSMAEPPGLLPNVSLLRLGARELRSALLLPNGDDGEDGEGPLPVLLDPYGGPMHQRVLAARGAFLQPQWFADQGFAVLVSDGRGTGGRGAAWDRAVRGDLATAPLQDQVDALQAAAQANPRLDLSRVAIRGWSFGGYLAALAVLRRPDVFHAAVAGAPVTDWRLYDTHYTERYLGHPDEEPENYRRSSLLDDAANLRRPLLLIHGLADDNVVVAHSLQLSRALLEAGRPHSVLPLSGVTHMTPQEAVAENLLLLQLAFLRQALGLPDAPAR